MKSKLLHLIVCAATVSSVFADVYIVPSGNSATVARVSSSATVSTLIGSGLQIPEQVMVMADGSLVIADSGLGKVLMIPAGGGTAVQLGDAIPGVCAIALDSAGDLLAASRSDRTLRKLGGMDTFDVMATLPVGAEPSGIVASGSKVYIADILGGRIYEVTGSNPAAEFSTGLTSPFAVALDAAGKLHATDAASGGRLVTFNPNGNAREVARGLGSIRGLTFDKTNIAHFVTSTGELRKISGSGSTLVAGGLGDARQLTSRSAVQSILAFTKKPVDQPSGALLGVINSPATGGGVVAFKSTLVTGIAGVTLANSQGLWKSVNGGSLQLVARKGFAPPGLPNDVVSSLADPIVSNSGKITFIATMAGGTAGTTLATNKAVFSDATGAMGPVLRKGSPAPGAGLDPAVKFSNFSQLVLASDAGPAVLATITGPGITLANNIGLWSVSSSGAVDLLIRKGDVITVAGKARKLSIIGVFKAPAQTSGQSRHVGSGRRFTFVGTFTDGYTALLLVEPGVPPTVLGEKSGLVGPAVPDAKFASFGIPAIGDDASIFSFIGKMATGSGGVTLSNVAGLFTQASGVNDLEVRNTFSVPDLNGAFYSSVTDPVSNAGGDYAFLGKMKTGFAGVTLSNAAAIWVDQGSGPVRVVQQGDQASGAVTGAKHTTFTSFVLPPTGGVIFVGGLSGTGVTTSNNSALWANDGAGATEMLLRKGDKLTVDGVQKTVLSIPIFKGILGLNGQSRHFDATGTVCTQVIFTDGTRAILSISQP